jgi:hypothetical protein
MSKLVRAGLEAVVTIIVTLAIIIGAFTALLGLPEVLALAGIYYVVWAAIILVTHLALSTRRRHIRLSFGVGTGVIVMGVHLVMFLTGNIAVEIAMVPVILHDFGFALVGMMVLNLVHLVIFRRKAPMAAAPAAPLTSERVDDIPAPSMKNLDLDLDLDEAQPA